MVDLPPEQINTAAPFNMALASLQRLHFLRVDASEARRARNVNDWIMVLDSQLSEMKSMVQFKPAEDTKVKDVKQKFHTIVKAHNGNHNCYDRQHDGRRNIEVCGHQGQAFFALSDYEMALSEIQYAHKLSMPGANDPSQAFKVGGM